ncbi:archease [Acidobacteriia bacterium AH_259_A11_L15]|nr:archease [Acidobacteriia bacterium AH_259_A11_L15]
MNKLKGRRGKGTSRQPKTKPTPRKVARPSRPFEFLDHPADVGFLARGNSLEELFAAAALALCDYGWKLETVRARQSIELRVRAASLEDLLYSWLSELLFLTDAEGWVFKRFSVERVEPTKAGGTSPQLEVRGRGHGEKFDPERHRARTYIKAVTYHQLAVEEKHGAWVATVYLDV